MTIFLTTQYLDEADRARRPDRRARPRPDRRRRARPTSSSAACTAATSALRFADLRTLAAARRAARRAPADGDDALTLQVPERRHRARRCARCSPELDEHAIDLDDLTIHTPDLDDVFFAVTGGRR